MSSYLEEHLGAKNLVAETTGDVNLDLALEVMRKTGEIVLDKTAAIEFSITCLLAGGHLLLEDVPGVGKTTLVQTIGKLSGLHTNRVQFTVDLLPADITGGAILNQKTQSFDFIPGPIFAQLIFADELNRASPRTQGALLQAMEEYQISIDGKTHDLPSPFFVIATQNPHQQLGTFPLPESQLDRFLMSLELDYASGQTEKLIFQSSDSREKITHLQPLLNAERLKTMQAQVQRIVVSDIVADYVGRLLEQSRNRKTDAQPLSTRAGIGLIRAAKAWAFLHGRDYLRPDDIQKVLVPVFSHRLGGNHGVRKGREWAIALQKQTQVPV